MPMSEKSGTHPINGIEKDNSADAGLQGPGNGDVHAKMEPHERAPRQHRHLVMAIWILAVCAAFLLGSTIVNIVATQRASEGANRQVEALNALNESMREVRKSIAELSRLIKELPEMQQQEEEEPYQRPRIGDEKI
jgi:hypothetical protein